MQTPALPGGTIHPNSSFQSTGSDDGHGRTDQRGRLASLDVPIAVGLIFVVTAVPIIVLLWDDKYGPVPLDVSRESSLHAFVVWLLAFFPAWLFMRFLTTRGPALWHEFVVNLHRLGLDGRRYLPKPPEQSEYHDLWVKSRKRRGDGRTGYHGRTLYQEKFDAYYGREISSALEESGGKNMTVVPTETLFPVVLAAAVFAVGWAAVLTASDDRLGTDGVLEAVEVAAFAFAGAYVFNLQTLIRRFFQTDLRASAYTSAIVRVISSVVIARALYETPLFDIPEDFGLGLAFLLGFFPLAGLETLRRAYERLFGNWVPTLRTTHPLSDIQGMNLWYEARLVEEGIEDMQELATANIVDVILHTRVPVSRLVDWLDQAHLLLYLEPKDQKSEKKADNSKGESASPPGMTLRQALEACGVRKATTFLVAFGAYRPVDNVASLKDSEPGEKATTSFRTLRDGELKKVNDLCGRWDPDENARQLARELSTTAGAWSEDSILTLVRIVANDTSITPVLNWRYWGAERLFKLERGLVASEEGS